MLTWLKRGLLGFCLLGLSLFAGLYFFGVSMIEAMVAPQLEGRGGQLELKAVRLRLTGVELVLERYAEAGLVVQGLSLACPWSQLWSVSNGFSGELSIEELWVRPEALARAEEPVEPQSAAERVAALAAQIDGWPLRGLELTVRNMRIETAEGVFSGVVEGSLYRSSAGETHLTGAFEGSHVNLDLRVKVLASGEGLALDFVGSAQDWAGFQAQYAQYAPAVLDRLAEARAELYLNNRIDGGGFLDVSGYTRWAAWESEKLSFTVLADLGAGEFYWPNGELLMQGVSAGLARDGDGVLQAFAKGAVESLRHGSWMQSGGAWALRGDGSHLAGELRLGEGLSLSLGLEDWSQAIGGMGRGQLHFEANPVGAEWLRVLPVGGLPDDLELAMGLKLEGQAEFKDFRVDSATMAAEVEIRQAVIPSRGLTLRDLQGQAQAAVAAGKFELQSLQLQLAEVLLSETAIKDLDVAATRQVDGTFKTSPLRANFMGGGLRVKSTTVAPANLEDFSIHAIVDRLELAQLAGAVPQFKGEISGTASGYLVAVWRDGQVILTDGRLEVDPETDARLQYQVDGLLTSGMSPGTAAYRQYRMAEKAFADLALKRFRIDIFPEGNRTRPFRLELFGESLQEGTLVPVDFALNVNVDDTAGLLEILHLMRQGQLDLN